MAQARTKTAAPKRRILKVPKRTNRQTRKTIKAGQKPLPSTVKLLRTSIGRLYQAWPLFIGISLVYSLLLLLFVQSQSSGSVSELKAAVQDGIGGEVSSLGVGVSVFGILLGSANSTASDVSSLYQTIIFIVVSLALLWSLRQQRPIKRWWLATKQAFYQSTHPLVPFLLVLVVVALQLLPVIMAGGIYNNVILGGVAQTLTEGVLWLGVLFGLLFISLYWLSSSVFALVIVTLPDTPPRKALRMAKQLVRFRRLTIMRRFLLFGVALVSIAGLIMVPLIMILPVLASGIFLLLSVAVLPLTWSFTYSMYQELLG